MMRIYWINKFEKGNLGMMARPRGNEWLEDEIKNLKHLGIDTVISLLQHDESIELEIQQEKSFCEKWNIEFMNHPINDRGVPGDENAFLKLVLEVDDKLKQGNRIVIHCRMGIGRTSLLAAGVLIRNGMEYEKVFDILSEIRTLSVPDTNEQKEWIRKLQNVLQKQ